MRVETLVTQAGPESPPFELRVFDSLDAPADSFALTHLRDGVATVTWPHLRSSSPTST